MENKRNSFFRYHSDVYFPNNVQEMMLEFIQTLTEEVDLTRHAAEQMHGDQRGRIPLPTNQELLRPDNKFIEFYERTDRRGRIQKAVIRVVGLNEKYDYSYVVAREGTIVTAWANDKSDRHRLTESKEHYIDGPEDNRLLNT